MKRREHAVTKSCLFWKQNKNADMRTWFTKEAPWYIWHCVVKTTFSDFLAFLPFYTIIATVNSFCWVNPVARTICKNRDNYY